MKKNESKTKIALCTLLAASSFIAILLFCLHLQTRGLPIISCLVIHTASLFVLWLDALNQSKGGEDICPDQKTSSEAHTNISVLTPCNSEADTPALALSEYQTDETICLPDPSEPEEKENHLSTANVSSQVHDDSLKQIYAEVRESLYKSCSLSKIDTSEPPTTDGNPEKNTPSITSNAFFHTPKELIKMDIIAAAKEAMESLRSFAERENIKLYLSTTCKNLMIKANPESIHVLFRNIIDNSIKYMGRPGRMIITISLLGDDIFLILKDTGLGLSEEETTHVFELNFQGSNRVSGNGLGLAQAKGIVEAFGGTIYAKSSPGNGMAIYIQIPVAEASVS